MSQLRLTLGTASLVAPEGWRLVSQSDEKVVLSSDLNQHATISLTRFVANITSEQFKTICDIQIRSVQKALPEGFIEPEQPFHDGETRGMFYFGGDQQSGRIFFGYVSVNRGDLITIFIEGVGIDPQAHALDFQAFVKGLKRN